MLLALLVWLRFPSMAESLPGQISSTLLSWKGWIGFSPLNPGPLAILTPLPTLVTETSGHWPCVIEVKTSMPKGRVFRFENCWMSHPGFLPLVASSWNAPCLHQDSAKLLTAKFKTLRSNLKSWQAQMANMKRTIANVKLIISFLDSIEEWRDLALHEWNFREILNQKLSSLLHL